MGRLLDFFFPLECLACGREGAHCCTACAADIRETELHAGGRNTAPLLEVRAPYAYAKPLVRTLIGDWKYRGYDAAAPALLGLAERWGRAKAGWLHGTTLVPVPLHFNRLRERGFNQAEILARSLASGAGVSVRTDLLERLIPTRSQARLTDEKRASNVRGVFRASSGAAGLDLVLVDDVWTSGATMKACAAVLLAAGARSVRGWTLAWGTGDKVEKTQQTRSKIV